jgi:hypothetical protein
MTIRPRWLVMGAGLLAAGWLVLFGDKAPDPAPGRRTGASAVRPAPAVAQRAAAPGPVILALQPRPALFGEANPASERLFVIQNWTPPPPPPPKPAPPPPPPPPMAPPLPYAYLGKKFEDGIWEAYLARGNQTFIVREHSVIEGSYRVDSIRPPNLSLTYLPLNQVQSLTIGGID